MTGIPKEVIDRIECLHCWHQTGILRSRCQREHVCCWCDRREWLQEKGLESIPGHGPHYPLPWTWTGYSPVIIRDRNDD